MNDSPSVAGRAALALALMVGFYGLALAMAWLLAWIPYAEWRYAHRVHFKLAFFCLAGGFLILKSIVPRPDRFVAPGPRLRPEDQPQLFEEVGRIASATGQQMPSEVYLVNEVNAWVSQRGGVMGLGSRRVMGIGLPLIQVLSASQLRAVLAHEFGHYHGGDVKVGPWIYKTREALVRTLQSLAGHSGVLTKPFELYARVFFRVSHAVSRHQELLADALAARVAGASALAGGLRAVEGAGLAFPHYWEKEVSPLLSAGFLPPLASGFARLIAEPKVIEQMRAAVEEEARAGKTDTYDTHPSLRERLEALEKQPTRAGEADDPPAIGLLQDLAEIERRLLAYLADREQVQRLVPVTWDEVGPKVLVPRWEAFLREHGPALSGVTAAGLPTLDWPSVGARVAQSAKLVDADHLEIADYAIGAGMGLALSRAGFVVEAPPGAPIALVRQGQRVEPFLLRQRFAAGHTSAESWRAFCIAAAITDMGLDRQGPHTNVSA
jgi:Zn-dependent protease with chaperone function